jgi:uncharacterized membrane protein YeaQ/YmgE (transglycosylase-associated protein family)
VTGERAPRGFVLPVVGLVLLFAALGPAIGAALFAPLAASLASSKAASSMAWTEWIATPFGHAVALFGAYVVGITPAAATGFVYALWDVVAPERAPRALVSAFIGAAMTYGLLLRLASLGASVEVTVDTNASWSTADWMDASVLGAFDATLRQAFVASGAVAGLVCAFAASLIGLTTRRSVAITAPGLPPARGA